MAVQRTIGATLTKALRAPEANDLVVPKLQSIGSVGVESEETEITALDSVGGFKEFTPTLKEAGELPIKGFIDASREADFAILVALSNSRFVDEWTIAFPSGGTWVFNAWVKMCKSADITVEGVTMFDMSLRVTGQPVYTAS